MAFTIRDYLAFIFVVHACLVLGWQALGPYPSAFVDGVGALLAAALSAGLVAGLYFMQPATRPVVVAIALTVLIFVQVRTGALAVLPSEAIGFLQMKPPTDTEVTFALAVVAAGTAALLLGIEAASRVMPDVPLRTPLARTFPAVGVLVMWFAAIMMAITTIYHLREGALPLAVGWLARLFEVDVALLITIVWLLVYPPSSRRLLVFGWALVCVWLALSVVGGSRGGAIRIATLMILALSLVPGARFSAPRFLSFIIVVAAVSQFTALGGHMVRLANVTGESGTKQLVHDLTRQDIYTTVAPREVETSFVEALKDLTRTLNPMLIRLGNFDYAVFALTRRGDPNVLDAYIRSPYALKRILNGLVPGELFDGTELSTAQIFTAAYRGYSLDHVRQNYLSEPWTIWGLAGVIFGPAGAILVLFTSGLLLQSLFCLLAAFPDPIKGVAQTMYLFLVVTGAVIMYGIDHMVLPIVHYAMATASAFAIVFLASRASRLIAMRG